MGRRAWGAELGPDETPFEAGLTYAVKLDKPADFIGKAALIAKEGQPLRKKLVTVVLDSGDDYVWGGESILLGGESVGELASAGWSPRAHAHGSVQAAMGAGACVGLGYLRGPAANQAHAGTAAFIDLWGEHRPVKLFDKWSAPLA